ncbi:MAG: CPBP family glutamic-type intramembrane protease [Byssovorax sp.]
MAKPAPPVAKDDAEIASKSDAWTDLGLTLPIFVAYHLGVVFLPVRNAADLVTSELRGLAKHSLPMYATLTLALGALFVIALVSLGQKRALAPSRFLFIALEGTLYAVLMRAASSYVVGSLRLAGAGGDGAFSSVVMALGAGFYEEIAFRVGVFGVGALVLRQLFGKGGTGVAVTVGWALCESAAFSGWHYVGTMGESFDLQSFAFRGVCGLFLTLIFAFRGFAPAVWTHAIYDVWVMVGG